MALCGFAQLGSLLVSVMDPVIALKSLLTYLLIITHIYYYYSYEETVGLSMEWRTKKQRCVKVLKKVCVM